MTSRQRVCSRLAATDYDLLVVGGGAFGAALAWHASSAGLTTALVEAGDYACGASSNSLKIIHGPIRYLGRGRPMAAWRYARAQQSWLDYAPHLVRPLPCVMPTTREILRNKLPMQAALTATDLLGKAQRRTLCSDRKLPAGRVMSRARAGELLPASIQNNITGAGRWYDGQMLDSERLVLSMIQAARQNEADALNHLRVKSLRIDGTDVTGAVVEDALAPGTEFSVTARVTALCAGSHNNTLLDLHPSAPLSPARGLTLGINIVLRRNLFGEDAMGLTSTFGDRHLLFFTPWRDQTVAGAYYVPCENVSDPLRVPPEAVQSFLDHLNAACPALELTHSDITTVYAGLLPTERPGTADAHALLHCIAHDHLEYNGIRGLITVGGAKYTMALRAARLATRITARQLKRSIHIEPSRLPDAPPSTATPLSEWQQQELETVGGMIPDAAAQRLITRYGAQWRQVAQLLRSEPELLRPLADGHPTLAVECLQAVLNEQAATLGDILFRRTDLCDGHRPSESIARAACELVAPRLGWSPEAQGQQLSALLNAAFPGDDLPCHSS